MSVLEQSIKDLIEQYGFDLLADPLRLEGFLKDLHPLEMASVSSAMEVLWSKVFVEIQRRMPRHDVIQILMLQSGLSLKYAEQAIDLWMVIVQHFEQYQDEAKSPNNISPNQNDPKTVDAVLSRFLNISKMES